MNDLQAVHRAECQDSSNRPQMCNTNTIAGARCHKMCRSSSFGDRVLCRVETSASSRMLEVAVNNTVSRMQFVERTDHLSLYYTIIFPHLF